MPKPAEVANLPVTILPVPGLPEIEPGADLARAIQGALRGSGMELEDGDVLVAAQKIVSKSEDARVALSTVTPSLFARRWAEDWGRDPRVVELVLGESRRIVRMERGIIITETHHGFVCANAGIDLSNTGDEDVAILLPRQPDQSARALCEGLLRETGRRVGVIIADSFGRPWRGGLTQVALGVAGLSPVLDLRDQPDADGRSLHVTIIALADEIACAADLVCGKLSRVPVAIVRGVPISGDGTAQALVRPPEMDLFR